jgi:hypothetical protein
MRITKTIIAILLASSRRSSCSVTVHTNFLTQHEILALQNVAKAVTINNEHTELTRISKEVKVDANLHQRIRAALQVDLQLNDSLSEPTTIYGIPPTDARTYVTSIVRSTTPHIDHYRQTRNVSVGPPYIHHFLRHHSPLYVLCAPA